MSNFINEASGVLLLPNDDTLISQMLERKSDMKKRGLKSPDRADAFVLTFWEYMVGADEHIMTPTIGSVPIER